MLIPLAYPPGLFRNGTEYQSAGRFWDANLWRWNGGTQGPVAGWSQLGASTLTGIARGMHGWVDLSGVYRAAIGTESRLNVCSSSGTITNITPAGMGTPAAGSVWTIDSAGQQLFAVNDDLGVVYTWVPGDIAATGLTNAPTATGLMVTDERTLMLFGVGGDPRQIQWCDAEVFTDWTLGNVLSLAGDWPLQTPGEIRCGKRIRGGYLIHTTQDLHLCRFLGFPDAYGFDRVGSECGIISARAAQVVNDLSIWMGRNDFFRWAGGVDTLPCDVKDDVFGSEAEPTRGINRTYVHLVHSVHIAEHNEIWWMYPKGAATECSHAAVYNYAENHWTLHTLARTAALERNEGFSYPLMTGSDGKIWQHEKGATYSGSSMPYAESGPMELGKGEGVHYALMVYPDEAHQGDVVTYFKTRMFPNGSETTHGPFASAMPTDVRFCGRQTRLRHELSGGQGRVGTYRVEVRPGGKR